MKTISHKVGIRAGDPLLILMTHLKIGDFLLLTAQLKFLTRIYPHWMIAVPDILFDLYEEHAVFPRIIPHKEAQAYLDHYNTQVLNLSYPLIRELAIPHDHFKLNSEYFKLPQHSSHSYTQALHEYFPALPRSFEARPFLDIITDEYILNKHGLVSFSYFTVHSGSDYFPKNWPTKNFERTLELILNRFPKVTCVSFVGPQDEELYLHKSKPDRFVSVKAPLREVAHILSGSLFHIDNDSGIHHLAGAIDVPSITVFGPTGPGTWKSLTQHNFVHWGGPSCPNHCEGARSAECPERVCLSSVAPESLLMSATRILTSEAVQAVVGEKYIH